MSSEQGERIRANCKTIWGNHDDYDLSIENDNCVDYQCFVRKDFGDSFGSPIAMTSCCPSSEAAWAELDRMLGLWASRVKRGTPMTKNERLETFGGPKGKHKAVLSKFMDEFQLREGAKKQA
ncbi:hypothetical protein QBC35DRAFT_510322 [Podospora australis]|uniref:Uncharacterized protein n=1 Tax=Podospora australis TaxID=1536484 RepID=A0AAN6WJ79_9PEZI|nr:hypothetical protein QBC35DRAFT_510322 [Podospora australis]